MSCSLGTVPRVRPGSARVQVTDLIGSGGINPTPNAAPCEDSVTAAETYLCPEKLELLCGTRDLSQVTSLEMCIDTQENTLGNFGAYLPKLVHLKMNNSVIMSVRDLGTSLSHLQVLWLSRCSLRDLDGISTLSTLKELYVSYNHISDLSPVGMLINLQLIDLEGNDVDDLVQVQYLGLCGSLRILTLEGNPVCVRPNPTAIQVTEDYSYRSAVRELIPQLRYLDNLKLEEVGSTFTCTPGKELAILRDSIRNSTQAAEDEEAADSPGTHSRPSSGQRPASSLSSIRPLSSASSRPHTGSRPSSATLLEILSPPGSRPASANSDLATVEAETSSLTHGAGKIVFCGNPVQAIRARREKLRTAPTRSALPPRDLPIHIPEHTYDLDEPSVGERVDVFAELKAWSEQHSRRLQAIKTEKQPQVLTIHYSEDEEKGSEEEKEEEEGFYSTESDSSDEGNMAETQNYSKDTVSPDSLLPSLSPELHHLSPDVARLSLSPDAAPSPSPPLCAAAAHGNKMPTGIRARRFRLSQTNSQLLADSSRVRSSSGTSSTAGETRLKDVPLLPHKPRPPPASALSEGLDGSCAQMDQPSSQTDKKHLQTPQRSKLLERSVISRPHTARAALQKHHRLHLTLQACRGSSHPD